MCRRGTQGRGRAYADERRAARARTALAVLPALVEHLVSPCGAWRVRLFGSLEEGGVHEHSSIDLAVAGLLPAISRFDGTASTKSDGLQWYQAVVPVSRRV